MIPAKITTISTALFRKKNELSTKIAQDSTQSGKQRTLQLSQRLGEDFNQVIDLILACRRTFGNRRIGKSGLIGKKKWWLPLPLRYTKFLLHPTEAFHGDLGMLKPD